MDNEIVILGGGVAGLGAANELGKEKSVIFEKKSHWGGLCNSFKIEDYVFDTAIHLSFTENNKVRKIFDETSYNIHIPEPSNYYKGKWIKHPIQNNLYFLSGKEKLEAINDFIHRPSLVEELNNYQEYLYAQYGKYIAENFMEIYTKKYWCTRSNDLSIDWIGNRMYQLSIEKLLEGALINKEKSEYYAREMRYPKKGGYKSFLEPLAEKTNILTNKKVESINTSKKYVEFSDGTKKYYKKLFSSIPLPELINKMADVNNEIREIAHKLHATSVILVSIGFKNTINYNKLWAYIYDENIPFCRMYLPHIKSSCNVPKGCSSIQCEVYYDRKNMTVINKDNIGEIVCEKLIDMNLCLKNDIKFVDVREEEYANVVFNLDTEKNKKILKEFIKSKEIELIGRFGEWEYFWSDQSLLSGINKAKEYKMKNGENL